MFLYFWHFKIKWDVSSVICLNPAFGCKHLIHIVDGVFYEKMNILLQLNKVITLLMILLYKSLLKWKWDFIWGFFQGSNQRMPSKKYLVFIKYFIVIDTTKWLLFSLYYIEIVHYLSHNWFYSNWNNEIASFYFP